MLLKLHRAQELYGELVKMEILIQPSRVEPEIPFLASSRLVLMLLVHELDL